MRCASNRLLRHQLSSLELTDAQVHVTSLVVICVRLDLLCLGVIANLHIECMRDFANDVCGMAEETGGPMRTAVRSIEALVRLYLPEAGAHGSNAQASKCVARATGYSGINCPPSN